MRKYGGLGFGSLHEVIKEMHEESLEQGKRCLVQGRMMHKKSLGSSLEQGLEEERKEVPYNLDRILY